MIERTVKILQRVKPGIVKAFNARVTNNTVYGEVSQPVVDQTKESLYVYHTISMDRTAIQILSAELDANEDLAVVYRICGPMARYVPDDHKLAIRGLVVNDELVNILTLDIVATPYQQPSSEQATKI